MALATPIYKELYLYSEKAWEIMPASIISFTLASGVKQNAPIVVTSSGWETTLPTDPWGEISGSGRWEKVGYGYFSLTPTGSYDMARKEFALEPGPTGTLVFNQPLPETTFVEYEAGASGYYILDSLDFNPIRDEAESGFLHYSKVTDPETLYLMTTQNALYSDGFRTAKLVASLFDVDFDRVSNKEIIFEIQNVNDWTDKGYLVPNKGSTYASDGSGIVTQIKETTNTHGEAAVTYKTFSGVTDIQNIKAYYLASSGVYDIVQIAQYYPSSDEFELDTSSLDTNDYLS